MSGIKLCNKRIYFKLKYYITLITLDLEQTRTLLQDTNVNTQTHIQIRKGINTDLKKNIFSLTSVKVGV